LVFSFGRDHCAAENIGPFCAEHSLKPFRILDEHLATIDYRQHDDQPDLDEEIQLIRHGASPFAAL
jgi:hypothetical protein